MKHVLVLGDTILDRYVKGDVDRISPEAPIPVLQEREKENALGGACNVAVNIKNLAPEGCGVDYFGFTSLEIFEMLQNEGINPLSVSCPKEKILTKTRYVSDNYQLLRVDKNLKYNNALCLVKDKLIKGYNLSKYDMIVISDYDKGTFSEAVAEYIFDNYGGPILVDLKKFRNWLGDFDLKNVVVKCNEKEYQENRVDTLNFYSLRGIVVTMGKNGYRILKPSPLGSRQVEARPIFKLGRPPVDPVGAGDTFLSGMAAVFLESGEFDLKRMAQNGNKAAAIRVSKYGKLVVTRREMENARRIEDTNSPL